MAQRPCLQGRVIEGSGDTLGAVGVGGRQCLRDSAQRRYLREPVGKGGGDTFSVSQEPRSSVRVVSATPRTLVSLRTGRMSGRSDSSNIGDAGGFRSGLAVRERCAGRRHGRTRRRPRLTLKHQTDSHPAAANGSNRIVLGWSLPTSIDGLTCIDDLYRPSCRYMASRCSGLQHTSIRAYVRLDDYGRLH